jgi:hypothetical protein
MRTTVAILLLAAASLPACAQAAPEKPPVVEKYLIEGKLVDGEKAVAKALEDNPKDAQARFSLGTVQFLRAVERMVQSFHRFGLRPDPAGGNIPFARLPLPENKAPKPIHYADLRAIFEAFVDDLRKAEATLAKVDDPVVKLPIHFGQIRLDIDGDGKAGEEETLWKLYARLNSQAGVTPEAAKEFVIEFDRGDVAWLRGYCHLLMAFGEFYLAHDGKELFDRTAHLFFARPDTPFASFGGGKAAGEGRPGIGQIADLVAVIHLLRLPVSEPKRMSAALDHLKAMLALSRESWESYMAEADDDHEWIPNPKQTGVIPGVKVTEEMVKGWTTTFLDEADALLAGRKLVAFWRGSDGRGVNLRRVFTEPREFDLVLWAQGTAATPYLERGEHTTPEAWQRLQRIFRGEFLGFAIWFN